MQQSFKSFIEAIQTAISESSESINKRNEKIIEDYFIVETEDVMLDNVSYNKELFEILYKIKNNVIFTDTIVRNRILELVPIINEKNETDLTKLTHLNSDNDSSLFEFNEEDQLIYKLIKFFHSQNVVVENELNSQLGKIDKNIKSVNDKIKIIEDKNIDKKKLEENLYHSENSLNSETEVQAKLNEYLILSKEWIEKINSWKSNKLTIQSDGISEHLLELNEFIGIENSLDSFQKYKNTLKEKKDLVITDLDSIIQKINSLNQQIESIKNEISLISKFDEELATLKNEQEKLKEKLFEMNNSKKYTSNLIELINECISKYLEVNILKIKDVVGKDKALKDEHLIKILKSVKRYKLKTIETLIPKTVRLNYPATFDYATPDNDKDYKIISTPIEVPLLTLVPISTCNIEKATLKANFKFNIDQDEVKIDFTNDKLMENESSLNFGSLEICLSPQQTPEGLKSLIESYENFLKRQIV